MVKKEGGEEPGIFILTFLRGSWRDSIAGRVVVLCIADLGSFSGIICPT